MNNRSLDESQLFEIYVLAAMKLLSLPLQEGEFRRLDMYQVWKEAMSFFPEELPQEDEESFFARPWSYLIAITQYAGERLASLDLQNEGESHDSSCTEPCTLGPSV